MAKIIDATTAYSNASGNYMRGLSAYQQWLLEGNNGSPQDFLDSLKAFSPEVSDYVEVEGGIQFTIRDERGEHVMFLPDGQDGKDGEDGLDITVTNTERLANGDIRVTLSDGTEFDVLKGDKGDQGIPGREVVISHDANGNIQWKYNENDDELKEVLNLGELAEDKFTETFEDFKFVKFVDALPDPANADDKVIYILRREV